MRLLPGKRPNNLGVSNGRFTAPSTRKPNWVNSQVETSDSHYIAPLAATGADAMAKLRRVIEGMPRVTIVKADGDYLNVEFETALMGYVDDVEFLRAGNLIHLRSSSRLGHSDLGANRKRVEAVRAALK